MRKTLAVALAIGLLAGAFVGPAEAGKKKKKAKAPVKVERVVELPYQCPCGPNTPVQGAGFWLAGGQFGGGPVATGATDNFVTWEVTDSMGQDVWVQMGQDTDGDLQAETDIGSACTKTDKALPVPAPGQQISVFVYIGTCDDGTPSLATSGTVKITFSNIE